MIVKHPTAGAMASVLGVVTAMLAIACNAGALERQVQPLPDIQAPSGGSAFWIAKAMRLNGVPMTIKSFMSPTNADEVLHQYDRKLRTSSDTTTRRTREAEWQVLAIMATDYYATIRTRDTAGGSEGTITVTPPLANLKPSKRTRFPHPESARVTSLQEYEDDGIAAEHISLVSRRSVTLEAREFASVMVRQGWQVLRDEPAAKRGSGHVIEAQKAAELALINLHRASHGGLTTILVVWRKA
jgi:hypothetical protein